MSERDRKTGSRRKKKKYRLNLKKFFRSLTVLILIIVCINLLIKATVGKEDNGEGEGIFSQIDSYISENVGGFINGNKDQWNLILVNAENPLPEGFQCETADIRDSKEVDSRIADKLNKMLSDGEAEGLEFVVCSAYRTVEYQQHLFDTQVAAYQEQGATYEDAYSRTATEIAKAGCSEHNTGLAVDIVAKSYQILDEQQAETLEMQWLMENCEKYGFILRYPKDKQDITKIIYEPWHFRYVGEKAAKEIKEKGICLEEYLEQ